MAKLKTPRKVMIVSESDSFYQMIKSIMPPEDFSPVFHATSGSDARRKLLELPVDILIVDSPLPDEHGVMFADSFSETNMGILLLVQNDMYEQASSQVEEEGIVTLPKPVSPEMFYTACRMVSAMTFKIQKMENEKKTLQDKMQDIRIVNKAKWLLIENEKMSEADAHKHIEKLSMDRRRSRREIAEEIIEEYE